MNFLYINFQPVKSILKLTSLSAVTFLPRENIILRKLRGMSGNVEKYEKRDPFVPR